LKTGVRLVDGDREMLIHPRVDVLPQALTVASPAVREVAEDRADDDGSRDSTVLFGARAVSLELVMLKDTVGCEALLDELKRFLHPRSRPYLYVVDDGWAQERRIMLRVDQWSEPYVGYVASQAREVQCQWRAPDGVWEAAEFVSEIVNADLPTTVGRAYPRVHPWAYAATQSAGASLVTNIGGVPSHFTARLYGPCTAPALINETTGEQLAFTTDLVLGAGQYVEVDTRERTAFLLSLTSQSRLGDIDFAVTSWWRLEPGEQRIRYAPAQTSAGAQAVIEYRPAWL
jgi:hypothetical protein